MKRQLNLTGQVLEQLTIDVDPWLSCDDCFDQVDAAVEGILTGTVELTAELRTHLWDCGACDEEAITLVTLVAPDYGIDPESALASLDAHMRR